MFDAVRGEWPDKATARDLGGRPVRSRCSDARVLDPETAVVADCERKCRRLLREWHDRRTAEDLAEAVHQRDLERAAQPPVIQVTVTTPPGGIPRLELEQAVARSCPPCRARGAARQPAVPATRWRILMLVGPAPVSSAGDLPWAASHVMGVRVP